MNTKKFLFSSLAGTIVYFLLGWVVYGLIFKDIYPQKEEYAHGMLFVFLGCLFFATFMAYVFAKWAGISLWTTGAKAGAVIGFFYAITMNFFMYSGMEMNNMNMGLDIVLGIVMGAITGAVIAFVNGKMK